MKQAWLIWTIATIFYTYEFFLRISPMVMVNDIINAFHISAAAFGLLSAFYYYAYASLQIPAGLLLDRYGTNHVLGVAALLVASGSLLLATTKIFALAKFARILMGIGSAFSFIACLKLASNWFPAPQFPLIIGLTNMLGVFGAMGGEAPLAVFVDHLGWRTSLLTCGIVGIGLSLLVFNFVKDHPKQSNTEAATPTVTSPRQDFYNVLTNKHSWWVAIIAGLMVAPISAFTELWSVPFLALAHHLDHAHAAALSSIMFLGIALGGPTLGALSAKLKNRKIIIQIGTLTALTCLCCILYKQGLNLTLLSFLLLLFGFATSSMLLCFAINAENHPPHARGMAIGFTNTLTMAGGALFQPLVGMILDTTGVVFTNTTTHSNLQGYRIALSTLPICLLLALIMTSQVRTNTRA